MKKRSFNRAWGLCLLASGLLLNSPPSWAHHSFGAEYDGTKPVTLTGVVSKIEWDNPHIHFYLDVKDADGKATTWKFEGYPPSVLSRIGWKREATMKVGDTVTVFAWRARDGTNSGHSRQVTFADGKKLYSGPPAGTGDGGNTPPVAVAQQ